MTPRRLTGGQAVVESLAAAGIRFAFTVPGESFLGVLDALHDAPLRTVATRHEGGAAFMAEAVGQLTGRPAVCLATRAVGAANLAIGLHTARQDSTPLVAVVGQVPRAFRGREAFQEVDQVATFGRLCKAAEEVHEPARLAETTARLVAEARSGRPGPVLLAVPEDALEEVVEATIPSPAEPPRPEPDEGPMDALMDALASAERPLVIAGAGVLRSGAAAALGPFVERAGLPLVAAWRRPDVLPNEHPNYLGMNGLSSPPCVRRRCLEADLILALGTRLNEAASFEYAVPGPDTILWQVDVEPGFPGDRRQPDHVLLADAGAFLAAALARLEAGRGLPRAAEARAAGLARDRAAYLAETTLPERAPDDPGRGVDPAEMMRSLAARLPARAVVATDAGNFAGWYARYLRLREGQRFLGPTSGAMGYGLPAAIGAAVAEPDRPAVALVGDGGLAMLMAELETAVRERARLVVLVHDNARYGTIRMHQERAHPGRVVATELGRIDFAAVAEACGAQALRVRHDDEVDGALAQAFEAPGVTLVHAHLDPSFLSVDRRLEA